MKKLPGPNLGYLQGHPCSRAPCEISWGLFCDNIIAQFLPLPGLGFSPWPHVIQRMQSNFLYIILTLRVCFLWKSTYNNSGSNPSHPHKHKMPLKKKKKKQKKKNPLPSLAHLGHCYLDCYTTWRLSVFTLGLMLCLSPATLTSRSKGLSMNSQHSFFGLFLAPLLGPFVITQWKLLFWFFPTFIAVFTYLQKAFINFHWNFFGSTCVKTRIHVLVLKCKRWSSHHGAAGNKSN